jgi:hypothetical protein
MTACSRCSYDPDATQGKSWTFTLAIDVPSQNAANANGARWSVQRKRYRALSSLAGALMVSSRNEHRIPQATGKRRVTLTRLIGKGKREYDYGNLVGGFKSVLDAMVRAGLLVDDSGRWVEERYQQEKAGDGKDGVRICIEEIPPR